MQKNDFGCISSLYKSLVCIAENIGSKNILESGIMSKPTLWRWKGQVNTEAPDCNIVLNLLKKDSGLTSLEQIAERYDEHISRFLKRSFPAAFEVEKRTIDQSAKLLVDEYDFQIYFMCASERGATLQEISFTLGKIAARKAGISEEQLTMELITSMGSFSLPKVQRLLELEIIKLDSNYYKSLESDTYIEEKDGLKQSLNMLLNNINPATWSTGENVFYMSTETVEPEITKKASLILKNAFLEVMKMLKENQSNSATAKPFAFCVAGESLIFEQPQTKKELH